MLLVQLYFITAYDVSSNMKIKIDYRNRDFIMYTPGKEAAHSAYTYELLMKLLYYMSSSSFKLFLSKCWCIVRYTV